MRPPRRPASLRCCGRCPHLPWWVPHVRRGALPGWHAALCCWAGGGAPLASRKDSLHLALPLLSLLTPRRQRHALRPRPRPARHDPLQGATTWRFMRPLRCWLAAGCIARLLARACHSILYCCCPLTTGCCAPSCVQTATPCSPSSGSRPRWRRRQRQQLGRFAPSDGANARRPLLPLH